jgi:predicted house-cleaning noncanonical NTP pyrophosphatase (MazG superfamily)
MKKLIRDNIPEIALKEGRTLDTYIEHEDQPYFDLLKSKLIEESHEVFHAAKREDLIEEIADVLTVIGELVRQLNCQDEVFQVAEIKIKEKGGFSKRIVLTK